MCIDLGTKLDECFGDLRLAGKRGNVQGSIPFLEDKNIDFYKFKKRRSTDFSEDREAILCDLP